MSVNRRKGLRMSRRQLLTAAGAVGAAGALGAAAAAAIGPDEPATGAITLAMVPDLTSGQVRSKVLEEWNEAHPDERVTVQWLPEPADGQRAQMVAAAQGGTLADVYMLDVIWIEEFAASGYIHELDAADYGLTDQADGRPGDFLDAPLETARYGGRYYSVPYSTNAGVFFYRTDALGQDWQPPATWADFATQVRGASGTAEYGYAGQLARYEGLTVNVLELIWSFSPPVGGEPVSPDAATAALAFLRQGQVEGWLHPSVTDFREAESFRAFTAGDLVVLRNWPYIYRSLDRAAVPGADTEVAREDVGTVPLLGASVLGGHNLAISTRTRRPDTCRALIQHLVGAEIQRRLFVDGGHPPVRGSLYTGPDAAAVYPHAAQLRLKIEDALSRPKTPFYPAVTEAIQTHVSRFLHDRDLTADATARGLVDAVDQALAGPSPSRRLWG